MRLYWSGGATSDWEEFVVTHMKYFWCWWSSWAHQNCLLRQKGSRWIWMIDLTLMKDSWRHSKSFPVTNVLNWWAESDTDGIQTVLNDTVILRWTRRILQDVLRSFFDIKDSWTNDRSSVLVYQLKINVWTNEQIVKWLVCSFVANETMLNEDSRVSLSSSSLAALQTHLKLSNSFVCMRKLIKNIQKYVKASVLV